MQLQPLAGCSSRVLLRLFWINRGVDAKYAFRFLYALILSASGGAVRSLERKIYQQKVASCSIQTPPIFILGHWRSGTTLLHNLLAQDPQFGYLSSYNAWLPEQSIETWPVSRWAVQQLMPSERPMDKIALSLDSPQEEEYAMGNFCPYSFYHGWAFPQKLRDYFERYVLFTSGQFKSEVHQCLIC
ncbi:MAG: sulfotransferase [Oculatellaceae cyanobacterium Prado106]|jgi:hypothetical protein|nr:sulfotransferase [Oculatellaceae cyanobacterium Prado106]